MSWKPDTEELPNSYEMAINRLLSTEKRLLKDPQLAGAYSKVITDLLKERLYSKVTLCEKDEKAWFPLTLQL